MTAFYGIKNEVNYNYDNGDRKSNDKKKVNKTSLTETVVRK